LTNQRAGICGIEGFDAGQRVHRKTAKLLGVTLRSCFYMSGNLSSPSFFSQS
jgi:hypothetical protein